MRSQENGHGRLPTREPDESRMLRRARAPGGGRGLVPVFMITVTYYRLRSAGRRGDPQGEEVPRACPATARFVSNSPATNAGSSRPGPEHIRHRIETSSAPRWCSWPPRACPTRSWRHAWIPRDRWLASGATVSSTNASRASMRSREAGDQPAFPPNVVVEVKRIACELPTVVGYRSRGGRCPICAAKWWRVGW